jgi:antitoxin (DNA-binding transcriptional repressor) of toxin-antitoxin stability system
VDEVSVDDLCDHAGEVVDRVERGETVIITRAGVPVAEMRPLPKPPLNVRALLNHWKGAPVVDVSTLRADIDAVIDPSL